MTIVSTGFDLSVSLVDTYGKITTKTYQLRADNYETAKQDADIIIEKLSAITLSVIVKYRIAEEFIYKPLSYPASSVRNAMQLSLTCVVSSASKKVNIKVPAPVPEIFLTPSGPSSKILNTTNQLLMDYMDIFRADGQAYIGKQKDLLRVSKGKRISVKASY